MVGKQKERGGLLYSSQGTTVSTRSMKVLVTLACHSLTSSGDVTNSIFITVIWGQPDEIVRNSVNAFVARAVCTRRELKSI